MHMRRNGVVAVIGVACALAAAPLATSAPASAASTPFGITTTPALSPAFSAGTTDYVVACAGHPTTHVVTTGAGSVDRRQAVPRPRRCASPSRARPVPPDHGRRSLVLRPVPAVRLPEVHRDGDRHTPDERVARDTGHVVERTARALRGRVRRAGRAGVVVPRSQHAGRREVLRAVDHRLGQRQRVRDRRHLLLPWAQRRGEAHRRHRPDDARRARSPTAAGRQLLRDSRRVAPGRRSVVMGPLVAVDHHRQRDRRAERREPGRVELERGRATSMSRPRTSTGGTSSPMWFT